MPHDQADVFEDFAREFIRRRQETHPPPPMQRILVGTDFSLCSLGAIEYAEALARRHDAELLVLHAEGLPLVGSEMADVTRAATERELARAAQHLRERGLRVRTLLRPGAPIEEILRAAETERADLVVVGTHGRKGVGHVLLGSVAEHVVRAAPCPVLTVGPRREAGA